MIPVLVSSMIKRFLLVALLCGSSLFAGEEFKVGEFHFEAEKPWILKPTTPMVKAALTHGEGGVLLKFYHFGKGQGGGVKANFRRWKSQFSKVEQASEKSLGDENQVLEILEVTGTYLDGPPMARQKTPKENFALLGAVIPHPSGDVFLKMTGPKDLVEKAKADFEALVKSAKK